MSRLIDFRARMYRRSYFLKRRLIVVLIHGNQFCCCCCFCPGHFLWNELLYCRSTFITKTCIFKYTENFTAKKWKFLDKKFWYFSYFCSKHRLWVLVRTNEYQQSMFLKRNKKNNVYPCKPPFYYIKVGFKGVKLYRRVFVLWTCSWLIGHLLTCDYGQPKGRNPLLVPCGTVDQTYLRTCIESFCFVLFCFLLLLFFFFCCCCFFAVCWIHLAIISYSI